MEALNQHLVEIGNLADLAIRDSHRRLLGGSDTNIADAPAWDRLIDVFSERVDATALDYCMAPLGSHELRVILKSVKVAASLRRAGHQAYWITVFVRSREPEISPHTLRDLDSVQKRISKVMDSINDVLRSLGKEKVLLSSYSRDVECDQILHSLLRVMSDAKNTEHVSSDLFLICRALDRIVGHLQAAIHELTLDHDAVPGKVSQLIYS
jgi:hypothetical protein